MFQPLRRAAFSALLLSAPVLRAAPPTTWTDGVAVYKSVDPIEGYLVPPRVFANGYTVPLEKVLAAATKMTAEQLREYVAGGRLKVTRDYPLFVFPNQGVNVFRWEGKHDGEQQILPAAFDGANWWSPGLMDGRTDVYEFLFYQPSDRKLCHVIVRQQNGQVGRDRIHTDRVRFGHFPPPEAILRQALETADAVVHLPRSYGGGPGELLDCLKGNLTLTELRAARGGRYLDSDSIVFLVRDGGGWTVRGRQNHLGERFGGSYTADFGPLGLRVPAVREKLAADASLKPYLEPQPLRWKLAREAAGKRDESGCTLRLVNRAAKAGDWLVFEATAGRGEPREWYTWPITRSQRDGGDPLFRFTVRRGETTAEMTTRGRFGEASWKRAEPEKAEAVGCEYRFIDCGSGVLKLALRPTATPWAGRVQLHYREITDRFGRTTGPTVSSQAIEAAVK